jgi:hypothetical protein
MFQFIYKGRFNCLITKEIFESHVEETYNEMKRQLDVKWSPAKIIITMEMDPKRPRGWGGMTEYDSKTEIVFRLHLQLFGYSKKEQTFDVINQLFDYVLRHELLHFFIPSIKNNSCWSEGVTDFMTIFHKKGSTEGNLLEYLVHLNQLYKEADDEEYKQHKYGYLTGYKKMLSLYNEDASVVDDMYKLIKDRHKNNDTYKKEYTPSDIIAYNPKFKTFFLGRCNKHFVDKLK